VVCTLDGSQCLLLKEITAATETVAELPVTLSLNCWSC